MQRDWLACTSTWRFQIKLVPTPRGHGTWTYASGTDTLDLRFGSDIKVNSDIRDCIAVCSQDQPSDGPGECYATGFLKERKSGADLGKMAPQRSPHAVTPDPVLQVPEDGSCMRHYPKRGLQSAPHHSNGRWTGCDAHATKDMLTGSHHRVRLRRPSMYCRASIPMPIPSCNLA